MIGNQSKYETKTITTSGKDKMVMELDVGYSVLKHHLILQTVATEREESLLQQVPHREWEDLSLIYRFQLWREESRSASVVVTNKLLNSFGITEAELYADAQTFAPVVAPVEIVNMNEVMESDFMLAENEPVLELEGIYIMTCNHAIYGAGCLFYNDLSRIIEEQLHANCYILPSSIHELILIKSNENTQAEELKKMVAIINRESVEKEELLCDSIYYCDIFKREIIRCC